MGTWDVGVLDDDMVLDMLYRIDNFDVITEYKRFISDFISEFISESENSNMSGNEILLIAEMIDTSLNGVDYDILMNDTEDTDLYGYKALFAWIANNPMPEYLDWAIDAIYVVRKWDAEVGWDEDCIDDRKRILDKISNRLKSYKESHR